MDCLVNFTAFPKDNYALDSLGVILIKIPSKIRVRIYVTQIQISTESGCINNHGCIDCDVVRGAFSRGFNSIKDNNNKSGLNLIKAHKL